MIHAYKYQGAGNDFVIIDNRKGDINLNDKQIRHLCDRRFGIGGDGMMLLGSSDKYDFTMKYFNADGFEGTMCGNGGRCLVAFAAHKKIKKFEFTAIDGYHKAEVLEYSEHKCIVRLKMRDIDIIEKHSEGYFLDTGSDHFVVFVDDVTNYDVDTEGKKWRWAERFPKGTNVNFVQIEPKRLSVRTYERGVEAETYACGTGVTASSIASYVNGCKNYTKFADAIGEHIKFDIKALGDKLAVDFIPIGGTSFREVYLTGPATFVFDTQIDI
ncbi:MAG: diaminopimelate epimerase [Bacteroidales bacterium]|nr:diaminopimelate epimerase [Bacteroidales bacterium]